MGTSYGESKTATHHLSHQWGDTTPIGKRIVAAIAEYEETTPASLPPLEQHINPDALDGLFETTADDGRRAGCVTFSYYGYTIIVQSTGQVMIRKR
jgi:hypothetical protein